MYDNKSLVRSIKQQLAVKPAAHLREIASSLGVSQTTIARALDAQRLSFKKLRSEAILEQAGRLLGLSLRSKKEIAYSLGFPSAGAFYEYLRRHVNVCRRRKEATSRPGAQTSGNGKNGGIFTRL